jgi:hypothetical protein
MLDKSTKLILHCPLDNPALLNEFVESCLANNVELISVFGEGCETVHGLIDDFIVGDGSDDTSFITTTWHENEVLADVLDFASAFGEGQGAIKQVRI